MNKKCYSLREDRQNSAKSNQLDAYYNAETKGNGPNSSDRHHDQAMKGGIFYWPG